MKIWDWFCDKYVIGYVFEFSKYPMRFLEFLQANKDFLTGKDIVFGFRINRIKLYVVYFVLWNAVVLPISMLLHPLLAKLDCHVSIIIAVILTLLFFALFQIFKEYLINRVSKKLLQRSWKNYFPHFEYEKHKEKVAHLFAEALEKDIPKHQIESFIIGGIVEDFPN
jgi:hypothetical protein